MHILEYGGVERAFAMPSEFYRDCTPLTSLYNSNLKTHMTEDETEEETRSFLNADDAQIKARSEVKMESTVGAPIGTPMEAQIGGLMGTPIEDQIGAQMGTPIGAPIETQMVTIVEAPIGAQMVAQMDTPMGAPNEAHVEDQNAVEVKLEDALDFPEVKI